MIISRAKREYWAEKVRPLKLSVLLVGWEEEKEDARLLQQQLVSRFLYIGHAIGRLLKSVWSLSARSKGRTHAIHRLDGLRN